MHQHFNGPRGRVNAQHIVPHVISHVHAPGAIKPNAIPHAVLGQGDKYFRLTGRRRAANGLLLGKIDRVNVTGPVTSRPLNAGGKGICRRQWRGDIERLRRAD